MFQLIDGAFNDVIPAPAEFAIQAALVIDGASPHLGHSAGVRHAALLLEFLQKARLF